MIQAALCFYPKTEKQAKSGLPQANGKAPTLDSNLIDGNISDRKALSRRWSLRKQIQYQAPENGGENGGGQVVEHENFPAAAAEESPRRSSTLLLDQLHSASQKVTKSISFRSHSNRETANKSEVAADGVDTVTQEKKSQPLSLINFGSRRFADDRSTVSNSEDEKQKQLQQPQHLSRNLSWRFSEGDEKNLALLKAPVSLDNRDGLLDTRNHSEQGFLHNSQSYIESDYSFQAISPAIPSPAIPKTKATVFKSFKSLVTSRSSTIIERVKTDDHGVTPSVPPPSQSDPALQLHPGDVTQTSPLAIEKDEEAEKDDEVQVRLQPISKAIAGWNRKRRWRKRSVGQSSSGVTTKEEDEEEKGRDQDDGMSTQSVRNSQPDSLSETKLRAVNCSLSPRGESDGHGISMQSEPIPHQDAAVHERSEKSSFSLEDSTEAWEQLGSGEGVPPAPADSATRQRRRKVRFYDCPSDCDNSLSAAADASSPERFLDPSETLLGKLSATKHHHIRYLEDELEQTRTLAAELKVDCEAQRELKLAFKVQAVRLGATLKKLRELAQENGLDPRGPEGKSPAHVSTVTPIAQPEASRASHGLHGTEEIDSSPELNLLKAQAKQFGWLCNPKEVFFQRVTVHVAILTADVSDNQDCYVEFREQIGTGSTADIFKGGWRNLEVAVKCLRPETFRGNTGAVRAFSREVELLSRQRHPYILRMFAACLSPPDHAWIISEYMALGTLTEWLHGTKTRERSRIAPLPPLAERLRIATEISIAMQHLHDMSPKILHRDLKPSNIFLDGNNHVRIADFNCARSLSAEDGVLTGETGTYVYMAPEVVAHDYYNEKCDIYSFAVILCELVSGNPPYIDTPFSPAEIACKVAQGTLRPTLPENHPQELVQLFTSSWDQEPAQRPSFSTITAALKVITKNILAS